MVCHLSITLHPRAVRLGCGKVAKHCCLALLLETMSITDATCPIEEENGASIGDQVDDEGEGGNEDGEDGEDLSMVAGIVADDEAIQEQGADEGAVEGACENNSDEDPGDEAEGPRPRKRRRIWSAGPSDATEGVMHVITLQALAKLVPELLELKYPVEYAPAHTPPSSLPLPPHCPPTPTQPLLGELSALRSRGGWGDEEGLSPPPPQKVLYLNSASHLQPLAFS